MRRLRKAKVWHFPSAIEIAYRRDMRAFVRNLMAASRDMLRPAIERATAEAYSYRPDQDQSDLSYAALADASYYAAIANAVQRLLAQMDAQAETLARHAADYGRAASSFNSKQFHIAIRNSLSVDVFQSEPWLLPELRAFEAENLRLIKSIPVQHVERLQGVITNALRQGDSTASIMRQIQEVYPVTQARAELIAADQIGKLNAQLTRQRQVGIGVKTAKWRGVLDSRERESHRALEGVEFSWKNPPLGGPGAPIRCRCWAEAVFPELKDIEGVISP